MSRSHGKKRAYFYACSSYYKKGTAVCGNKLLTPMATADNEVLTKMETDLLRPQAVNAIIDRVVKHYATPQETDENRRTALSRSIAKVEAEQQRLVNAVAKGGETVTVLVDALQKGQERLDTMKNELDALVRPRARCADSTALREAVRETARGLAQPPAVQQRRGPPHHVETAERTSGLHAEARRAYVSSTSSRVKERFGRLSKE